MTEHSAAIGHPGAAKTTALRILLPAGLAALLGITLLVITGFVQIDAVHNAAHDARHATGFPCH